MRTGGRLIWAGWKFHAKNLTMSGFYLLTSAIQPVIFATIAFFMFKAGAREGTLLYVSLGAGLMGIWSATLFASGARSSGSAGRARSSWGSRRRRRSCSSCCR
jgi:hypothetical protein